MNAVERRSYVVGQSNDELLAASKRDLSSGLRAVVLREMCDRGVDAS